MKYQWINNGINNQTLKILNFENNCDQKQDMYFGQNKTIFWFAFGSKRCLRTR